MCEWEVKTENGEERRKEGGREDGEWRYADPMFAYPRIEERRRPWSLGSVGRLGKGWDRTRTRFCFWCIGMYVCDEDRYGTSVEGEECFFYERMCGRVDGV